MVFMISGLSSLFQHTIGGEQRRAEESRDRRAEERARVYLVTARFV